MQFKLERKKIIIIVVFLSLLTALALFLSFRQKPRTTLTSQNKDQIVAEKGLLFDFNLIPDGYEINNGASELPQIQPIQGSDIANVDMDYYCDNPTDPKFCTTFSSGKAVVMTQGGNTIIATTYYAESSELGQGYFDAQKEFLKQGSVNCAGGAIVSSDKTVWVYLIGIKGTETDYVAADMLGKLQEITGFETLYKCALPTD